MTRGRHIVCVAIEADLGLVSTFFETKVLGDLL